MPRAQAHQALSAQGLLDALARNLSAEEERWFPWWVAGFGAGIAAYFGLQDEPFMAFAAAVGVAAMAAAFAMFKSQGVPLRFLCAMIAAGGFGFTAAKLGTELAAGPAIQRDLESIGISGRIESVDIARPNRARIVLAPDRVGNAGQTPPARLRLTLSGASAVAAVHPGDWVSARAELRPPPEPAMPHGYDFARWAYFQGIGGVGFTYGAPEPIEAPRPDTWLERFGTAVEGWRMAMTERIRKALRGPDGSIAAALITGERGAIPADDTAAYRDSGLSPCAVDLRPAFGARRFGYLLAGPGGACAVSERCADPADQEMGGGCGLRQRQLLPSHPWRRGACVAVVSDAVGVLLSVVADRPALSMRGVAMAALVILAVQPQDIVDPGFQMSFAAVVGLIALAEWAASRPKTQGGATASIFGVPARLRRYLLGILAASFVATLMTTPFAIYHFDWAASYSLLANLLAEPIVAFVIMPTAVLAVILMPFGWEYGPLQVMGWGVHQMTAIAHFVADLPGATTLVRALPDAALQQF